MMAATTETWESHLQALKDEAVYFSRKAQKSKSHSEIWESHLHAIKDEALSFSRRAIQSQSHIESRLSGQRLHSGFNKKRPSLPPLNNTSHPIQTSSESALPQEVALTISTPQAPPARVENASRRPTPPYSSRHPMPVAAKTIGVSSCSSDRRPSTENLTLPDSSVLANCTSENLIVPNSSPEKRLAAASDLSEKTLAELVLQGLSAASTQLDSDTSWRQRPGVNDHCLLSAVQLIQKGWRYSRAQRQLIAARLHLGCSSMAESRQSVGDSLSVFACGGVHDCANVQQILPDIVWCEAAAYRQPSVYDALRVQRRWILQSDVVDQTSLVTNLNTAESSSTFADMVRFEKRFQLRAARCGAWRPPCALGVRACKVLEAQMLVWTDALQASSELEPLRVCLCLFKLIVAGSCLSRRECSSASKVLQLVDDILDAALDHTYLHAVAPQIRARVLHLQARKSLLRHELDVAVKDSQRALVLLSDRHGPRDFWPPHCWEIAACHRIIVHSMAYASHPPKSSAALRDLERLVAPAPMREAEPQLTACLEEDASAMRVECEVLERADGAALQPSGAAAETLHSLFGLAESALKKMLNAHSRARMLAVLAKLHMLQELQWHAAGAGRPETMETAAERLRNAFGALGITGVVQKVLPVKIVCLVLCDDGDAGVSLADEWSRRCGNLFGEGDDLALRARLAAEDLRKVVPMPGSSKKHITRALRMILACTGVGIREVDAA